jgi:hypothetical protein
VAHDWGAILILALVMTLHAPAPARAIFHLAVIDEVMTSYGGNANVQFVEIRMLAIFQIFVRNTVIGAFDTNGNHLGDVLVLPNDLGNQGAGIPWLMGTAAFAAASGVTPDFVIPAILPTGGGMICWGAPGNGLSVPNPASWDHGDPDNYTDCLAYGTYDGPSNKFIGTPTSQTADGHSLQRLAETHDNSTDFDCADVATPANNTSGTASLPATASCSECGNGSAEPPAEECDGADAAACPGQCRSDCTCPAVCGDGDAEPPEACDGGDDVACPGECLPDCTCPTILDSVKCYAAKDLKDPKFPGATAAVADPLLSVEVQFDAPKPGLICPPVNVEAEGVLQSDGRLTCYKIKGPKLDAANRPVLGVEDRFGTLSLEVKKPALLCLPPSTSPSLILDPFVCYAVKDLKDPKFAAATVSLADEFGVNDGDFAVQKPAMFCTPAEVDGAEVAQPKGQLTCYKVKGPKLDAGARPSVEVTDRFGALRLEASKPAFLCVPSSIVAP